MRQGDGQGRKGLDTPQCSQSGHSPDRDHCLRCMQTGAYVALRSAAGLGTHRVDLGAAQEGKRGTEGGGGEVGRDDLDKVRGAKRSARLVLGQPQRDAAGGIQVQVAAWLGLCKGGRAQGTGHRGGQREKMKRCALHLRPDAKRAPGRALTFMAYLST